jgi:hypothetical protein
LAYGRLIVERGSIPATEPLMPLCEGVPFVDFSWLSEILADLAYEWRGAPAIQFLYAASVTACVATLVVCTVRKTGTIWAGAIAAALYVWIDWQQLAIVRPQLAGCVCFLLLFAIAQRVMASRRGTHGMGLVGSLIVAVFALWANLHGSFLIGLATLAVFVLGRAGDLVRRTGKLSVVRDDPRVQRGVLFLILASVAVLLNPYGWRIYAAAWHLSSSPNLADLVEWKPLQLWMWQGRAALTVSLGLLGLYALTPRRISTTELLLLVVFGAATLAKSRMIVWWGPVAGYYAALHATAIWKRWGPPTVKNLGTVRWTVPAHFALWVTYAALFFTPLARPVIHRAPMALRESCSSETPIEAANFLRATPPDGQIFNTLESGDYLLWDGPPRLKVFVASHAHLVPRSVWEDYIRIITLDVGWQKILEGYRINTAIVDDDQHAALANALREDPSWSVAYEDDRGLIFVRRRPL